MASLLETYANGTRVLVGYSGAVSTFQDFRDSAWFSLATLTSVGYGVTLPSNHWVSGGGSGWKAVRFTW